MIRERQEQRRTIDPLIVAQIHNIQQSPIGQLPEELLLIVIRYLGDDRLSLYCLRPVSARFRRIIWEPDVYKHIGLLWSRPGKHVCGGERISL